jgi:hypothetical protein
MKKKYGVDSNLWTVHKDPLWTITNPIIIRDVIKNYNYKNPILFYDEWEGKIVFLHGGLYNASEPHALIHSFHFQQTKIARFFLLRSHQPSPYPKTPQILLKTCILNCLCSQTIF